MFWSILHIVEISLWFMMAASVAYVVFFAIISLFYEKDDFASTHSASPPAAFSYSFPPITRTLSSSTPSINFSIRNIQLTSSRS